MKQIIAIDLDGALIKSRPFKVSHKKWFELMAILLDDESVKDYAKIEGDYFPKVHEVMKRYLGDVSKETRTFFARKLYAMVTISEINQDDFVGDFADLLKELKDKYQLALITTAPEASVEPILQKLGCSDLFDIVYKSPMGKHPNKREMFVEFINEHGAPKYYIGDGDENMNICKELHISTISVNWVSKSKIKGDYDVSTVEELRKSLLI